METRKEDTMDSSHVSLTVTVDRNEDLGGAPTFYATAENDRGDGASGKSNHSPALAIGEAAGKLIDRFY